MQIFWVSSTLTFYAPLQQIFRNSFYVLLKVSPWIGPWLQRDHFECNIFESPFSTAIVSIQFSPLIFFVQIEPQCQCQ